MTEFDSCRIGDVGVRFDGGGALEFHSTLPSSSGTLVSERKALCQLFRTRTAYSLSSCFICEPSGSLSLNEDGCTVLRVLLPHSSPSWLPLNCVDAHHHSQILSTVADQLCEWHSVGVIHRTISPSCILVDLSPPSSTKQSGPVVVLLHWACSSFFDASSNAVITHSKLPHRVPSFTAPERLRLDAGAQPSPSEDFYGLGIIVRSLLNSGGASILKQPTSVPNGGASSDDLSAPSLNEPLNSDWLWSLHVLNKPASTVLDHILQPDPLLRAFRPSNLQKLIDVHGSQVFTASCSSFVERHQSDTDMLSLLSISASTPKSSTDSEVASLAWIQDIICELVVGKCVASLLCREILNVFVTGVSVKKDVIMFLHKLVQNRVLFKPVTWFTYLDIDALKQNDISVEKSTSLMQQYTTLDPCIQAFLLHLAVCPYLMPFDELVGIVKVDTPVSYHALVATGAVKSAVICGMNCVRLASEEFGALLEARFVKETTALDQKFISLFSSRKLPMTHPLGLSLAIHVARISRDPSSLSQYLSEKSSLRISDMMTILLHAAALLNATPSLCKSQVWTSEAFALTGIGLKMKFNKQDLADTQNALKYFHLYCELHRSMARKSGYKVPDGIDLEPLAASSPLLVAEAALVNGEPSFLSSKFSEAWISVEQAVESMKGTVRSGATEQRTPLTLSQQLEEWAKTKFDPFSGRTSSSDQLWNLARRSFIIAYSSGHDMLVRLLASLVSSSKALVPGGAESSSFTIGLAKPDVELSALSLLHIASLNGSFRNEGQAKKSPIARLTFISEVGMSAQDAAGQILDNSVLFALRSLEKLPKSLQFMDNLFWFVQAFFPLKHQHDKEFILLRIIDVHFGQQERKSICESELSSSVSHHLSAAAVLELIGSHYSNFNDNMYRFFANFWSVVFCVFEGAFVEQNLISAISVFEADAKASGPIFMHDAFIRLRVILQSSCRSRDLSTQNDKQAIQLTLDDADFEGIPLHLQVGLLACRGMMLLHNGTYFSNGFFESELVDIPALHFFDRAEQVSHLVVPRVVRIGVLFAKSFIAFRRSLYFKGQTELHAKQEGSSTPVSRGSASRPRGASQSTSSFGHQLSCYNEGLKYWRSLVKLLGVKVPVLDKQVAGECDTTLLSLIAPNSSIIQFNENTYGFGMCVFCLAMMSLQQEDKPMITAEYMRIALRLLLRDKMYLYASIVLEQASNVSVFSESELAHMLVQSIAIRSFIGHSESIFKLFTSPVGWSVIGTRHFSYFQELPSVEFAPLGSVSGSIRAMKRCMCSPRAFGPETMNLHSKLAAIKLQVLNLGATLKRNLESMPLPDQSTFDAVQETSEQDPLSEHIVRMLECASTSIAREVHASRIVIVRGTSSNARRCLRCLTFKSCSSGGIDVGFVSPASSAPDSNGVSALVLDHVCKHGSNSIFVESYPLSTISDSKTKRPTPGVVSFAMDPVLAASKVRSIAVISLSICDGLDSYFLWIENSMVANLFGADSSQEAALTSLTSIFFCRMKDELLATIRKVLSPEPSKDAREVASFDEPEPIGRMTVGAAPNRGTVSGSAELIKRTTISSKVNSLDLLPASATSPTVLSYQADVNFLLQSKSGSSWKMRRVVLESSVISYTDKFAKKQPLVELVLASVVDEPSASSISPRSPPEFQFVLRIEGVSEKRTSIVCFAFCDESSRETWKSYVTQAIDNVAEDHKRKGVTIINVCNPKMEEMEPMQMVGRGGFGEVWEYCWGGISLAVKKLSADLNSKNIFLFKQEAELMSKMRHPNILLYISSCLEPPNMYIVTEFMARGSLHSVLNDPTIPLSWYMRVRMALDCASAMLYLHSSEPCIVHRDLKAENLLVSDSWNVKVCDFGLTRFSAQVDPSRGGFSSSSGMTSNIGSTRYCAPEVLGHRGKHVRGFTMNMLSEFSGLLVRRLFTCPQVPYTNSVDVHSFGMILYELAHRGKRPYWQLNQDFDLIRQKIIAGERPKFDDVTAPAEFRELYRSCVHHDPQYRPTFAVIRFFLRMIDVFPNMVFTLEQQTAGSAAALSGIRTTGASELWCGCGPAAANGNAVMAQRDH